MICFKCHQVGHKQFNCPLNTQKRVERVPNCNYCRRKGHSIENCLKKNKNNHNSTNFNKNNNAQESKRLCFWCQIKMKIINSIKILKLTIWYKNVL